MLVAAALALGACTDSLDPEDWYAATVGEEPAPESDAPVPGAEEGYPNLAEVPAATPESSSPEEIAQVAESLAADLANAQYTSDPQRVDDETTPLAMPEIPVAETVEETEITLIEPGGEVEIADSYTVDAPAAEEVVEETAATATSDGATIVEEAVVVETVEPAPPSAEQAAPQPEPAELASAAVESRVETETVRDESGELVGTVTRVVTAREVVVATDGQEPMADDIVVEETSVEPEAVAVVVAPPSQDTGAQDVDPAAEAELAAALAAEDMAPVVEQDGSGGGSLVAKSEVTAPPAPPVEQVVVVPEYAADLAASELEAVAPQVPAASSAATAAAEAPAAEPVLKETRIEQSTVVEDGTGELVGATTRTVEVTETVTQVPAASVATEAGEVDFDQVAETLAAPAAPSVEPVVTTVPAVAASPEPMDFTAMLAASGPDAGTSTQPVIIASAQPEPAAQAAFTTFGATTAQTLAAIIRFGDGSTALGAAERDILRQLAAIHAERGGAIRLVGRASKPAGGLESTGQELVNFKISLDRATAVAEELIRLGVPRDAVIVEATGDSAASGDAASDRRVDIYIGA